MYISSQKIDRYNPIWPYHLGRIVTYAILGIASVALGILFTWAGFPRIISFISGVLLIAVSTLGILKNNSWKNTFKISLVFEQAKKILNFSSKQSPLHFFFLGIINGLLPCGMLYTALIASSAMGSIVEGALFMIFFGIGTSPALTLVFSIQNILSSKTRLMMYKLMPLWTILLGILFILRSLQLGIPFLSPENPSVQHTNKACVAVQMAK
jgi:hypothetical protein